MISDTLSDAVSEIRRYQKESAESDISGGYVGLETEIDNVCEVMDALRIYLDRPPSVTGQALSKALRHLDLSEIRQVCAAMKRRCGQAHPKSLQ